MLRFFGLLLGCAFAMQGAAVAQNSRGSEAVTRDVIQPPPTNNAADETAPIQMQDIADGNRIDQVSVQVGAVQITGLSQLSQRDFADIAERYAGRNLDTAGLQGLARAIADRARDRGYLFASAVVPPQEMEIGIVQVLLNEGAIDEVRVEGSDNARVRELLTGLVGTAVRKPDVERLILLADDVPGITIDRTRFIRENGRGILVVEVSHDDARGSVRIDNAGPNAFGPVRARLEVELNGLLDADDQFVTYTQATPVNLRELTFISARYTNIVSHDGLQLGISAGAGRTRNHDRESGRISRGRNRYAAVSLTAPVIRSSDASLWVSSEFGYLGVEQNFGDGFGQQDDIATFTLSSWSNLRTGNGRLQAGVSVTRGIGVLGATRAGDVSASRIDGSGRFTKANVWANWNEKLGRGYAIRLAATGQIASRPLLSSQEIGFGGTSYGRGYDFSERFGDQGVMGLAELRRGFDRPAGRLDWAQLYGFVDGGYIDNIGDGFGGGTLFSGGGGVRAGLNGTEIGVEIAQPINAARFESGDRSPKVNLTISHGF
jgi:hemolysin activation/secretion protein